MAKHPVDVYLGEYPNMDAVDPGVGARAVFRHLERMYAYNEERNWASWFEERPEDLNRVIGILQNDPSYNTYSEHVLDGMGYWTKENLVSSTNLSNVDVFGHMVAPATWHMLGQRDHGDILKEMVTVSANLGLSWGRTLAFKTPHSTALAFYQSSLQAAVDGYRSGDSYEELERWCKLASKMPMLDTWQLFVERYPDCSALFVCHCIQTQHNPGTSDFLAAWAQKHPAQHALVYAFVQQSPIAWSLNEDVSFGTNVHERTEHARLLLSSFLTPTADPVQFLRAFAGMQLNTPEVPSLVLALPPGMDL